MFYGSVCLRAALLSAHNEQHTVEEIQHLAQYEAASGRIEAPHAGPLVGKLLFRCDLFLVFTDRMSSSTKAIPRAAQCSSREAEKQQHGSAKKKKKKLFHMAA